MRRQAIDRGKIFAKDIFFFQRWIFLIKKGTIHKEDRHHKVLDTLKTKEEIYIMQKSEQI